MTHFHVAQEADRLYHESLTPAQHVAIPELAFHLRSSFGSPARLDYGTGHELSFLAFLLILRLVGAFTAEDEPALARETFAIYLDVMKQVHKTFRLEAAGKMGIWGMDENHHLVYHWEASQTRSESPSGSARSLSLSRGSACCQGQVWERALTLNTPTPAVHPSKRPALLVAPPGAAGISYLFLSSLLHLHGDPVPATSSADASPDKSFEGLLRLYKHEVLDRLPVVQHFRFGPVLRWALPEGASLLPSTSDDLTDEELEALNATLDRRVTADGTVAPWALPTLSGNSTPEEILERLPSPALSRNSRTASPAGGEQRTAARSGSVSPRMRTSPLPYLSSSPPSSSPSLTVGTDGAAAVFGSPTRSPMPRRMSRLSICEVNANEEADSESHAQGGQQDSAEAIRAAMKSGNKDLVAEGDESTFDFV